MKKNIFLTLLLLAGASVTFAAAGGYREDFSAIPDDELTIRIESAEGSLGRRLDQLREEKNKLKEHIARLKEMANRKILPLEETIGTISSTLSNLKLEQARRAVPAARPLDDPAGNILIGGQVTVDGRTSFTEIMVPKYITVNDYVEILRSLYPEQNDKNILIIDRGKSINRVEDLEKSVWSVVNSKEYILRLQIIFR